MKYQPANGARPINPEDHEFLNLTFVLESQHQDLNFRVIEYLDLSQFAIIDCKINAVLKPPTPIIFNISSQLIQIYDNPACRKSRKTIFLMG
jgi:hypothetical protein